MRKITARIPDDMLILLDKAAKRLRRSRADVIRQAVEHYLDDYVDLAESLAAFQDPSDPVMDWESVRLRIAHRRDVYRR